MKKLISLALAVLLLTAAAVTAFAADAYADASKIDSMTKGEAFRVENSAPVLSAELLDALAKLNDYKAAAIAGTGWRVSANVYGLKAQNMTASEEVVKAVAQAYEDAEFKFLSFTGSPKFASKAEITVDVSALAESFGGSFHAYRYFNGKLYRLNSQYSAADGSVTFYANNELGSYVLADRELTGSLLATGGATSGSSSSSSSSQSASGSSSSTGSSGSSQSATEPNPDTGAADVIGVISALALMAAVSAAALSLKK